MGVEKHRKKQVLFFAHPSFLLFALGPSFLMQGLKTKTHILTAFFLSIQSGFNQYCIQ